MRILSITLAAALTIATVQPAASQGALNSLKNKVSNAVQKEVGKATQTATSAAKETSAAPAPAAEGKTFYVSASTGSARASTG